jgi:hypothetical protein
LTKSGLIIRKEKEKDSKIHQIISFHRPLSLTPSDMLSIGQNGVAICGSSPIGIMSHHEGNHTPPSGKEVEFDMKMDANTKHRCKSSFEQLNNVEISFDNRDDMNEWIDAIMTQYENCIV